MGNSVLQPASCEHALNKQRRNVLRCEFTARSHVPYSNGRRGENRAQGMSRNWSDPLNEENSVQFRCENNIFDAIWDAALNSVQVASLEMLTMKAKPRPSLINWMKLSECCVDVNYDDVASNNRSLKEVVMIQISITPRLSESSNETKLRWTTSLTTATYRIGQIHWRYWMSDDRTMIPGDKPQTMEGNRR